jgi:hypothetical protein
MVIGIMGSKSLEELTEVKHVFISISGPTTENAFIDKHNK